MKKTILLFALCVVLSISFVHAQNRPSGNRTNAERTKVLLQRGPNETCHGIKEVLSEKWNDSVQVFNWKSSVSDWSLNRREFRTRSQNGYIASRHYIMLDTISHLWVNLWADSMNYFGTSGDLQLESFSLWDPGTSTWIKYSYYHYYQANKPDEYYFKAWNAQNHSYDYGNRTLLQYDGHGNTSDETDQTLDTATNLWVNNYRNQYTYNSAEFLVEYKQMNWDTVVADWTENLKLEYIYDANNMLVETQQYWWYSGMWNSGPRSVYTNNSHGLPLVRIDENFNGSSWDTSYRVEFTYDASDTNISTTLEQSYDKINHLWLNRYMETTTYFSTGGISSYTAQLWNSVSNSWMTWRYFEYDNSGNTLDTYYFSIDQVTFAIAYGTRFIDTYDANGRIVQDIRKMWDAGSNGWVDYSKDVQTYEDPVNNYYVEEISTLWDGVNWVNDTKYLYYWSDPSGIDNRKEGARLCFYQNPMEQGQPVSCPFLDPAKTYQFDLISMKGEKVYNETLNGGCSFVINRTLSPGNYILRISANGKLVYRDKVVVVK